LRIFYSFVWFWFFDNIVWFYWAQHCSLLFLSHSLRFWFYWDSLDILSLRTCLTDVMSPVWQPMGVYSCENMNNQTKRLSFHTGSFELRELESSIMEIIKIIFKVFIIRKIS
jgi:hypothetical protein